MSLLWLVACQPPSVPAEQTPARRGASNPPAEPAFTASVEPAEIAFPSALVGDTFEAVVKVTNTSAVFLELERAKAGCPDVTVSGPFGTHMANGDVSVLHILWTATTGGIVDCPVGVVLEDPTGLEEMLMIAVSGETVDPRLAVSATALDFGRMSVGCEPSQTLTLTGVGASSVTVDSIEVVEGSESWWVSTAEGGPTFPLVLESGASQDLEIHFEPLAEGTFTGLVEIVSDDLDNQMDRVDLHGAAHGQKPMSETFFATGDHVTALFAVNAVALVDDRFLEAFPSYVSGLAARGVPYRFAVVTAAGGTLAGDVPFVDDSFAADEALAAVEAMVASPPADNDALLSTLGKAAVANRSWLIDEADEWAASSLQLIAINSDLEQSMGSSVSYVNDYQNYKGNPVQVHVDAIAGPEPKGCAANGTSAEPSSLLVEATTATGGAFLDWCDDWSSHFTSLAAETFDAGLHYPLSYAADLATIEVYIDGSENSTGFTYEDQGITFEADHAPTGGAEVRVDYVTAAECSG